MSENRASSQHPRDPRKELKIAESQISAILAIAADAIISLDDQLRVTLFNDGATALFGYSAGEIIGQPLETLIPERSRGLHHRHVADFTASPVAARKMGNRQEIFARRKDGSEFPAEASIAKQDIDGRKFFMVVLRDVTERKRTEAALALANSQLEQRVAERTRELESEISRREEAQDALIQAQRMEAFGQLTGGVAHDFNNLLTIVTGNLELLHDQLESEEALHLLRRAASAADMGASLTKRLLTFARRRRLSPQVLDVNEQIVGLTELLKRSLGEPITLTTMLVGDVWLTRADPSELENAILNLAINARDAMPSGGNLIIETRNVPALEGELKSPDDCILISVSDTGTGMSPEVIEHAFEPFFTTKEPGRGTGLGLSTVYGFAEQSGGRVVIASEVDKGTTVSIYLPRSEPDTKQAPNADVPPAIPFAENDETVLVVEDNPDVRELTLQRVEGLGYVALEAENGPAAMRILDSGEHVDIMLTDLVMAGGMSGYELAKWTRQHHPAVRIVLTTGYAAEETAGNLGDFEALPVLRKPYQRIELASTLRDALRDAQARLTDPAKT